MLGAWGIPASPAARDRVAKAPALELRGRKGCAHSYSVWFSVRPDIALGDRIERFCTADVVETQHFHRLRETQQYVDSLFSIFCCWLL